MANPDFSHVLNSVMPPIGTESDEPTSAPYVPSWQMGPGYLRERMAMHEANERKYQRARAKQSTGQ